MTDKIRIKKFIQNNRKRFTKWGDAAAEKNLHNSMEANDLLVRFCDAVISFIDSLQEEPVAPKVLEDMLNAKTAAESLGISQEEHDRIVDELIYGKEPELVDDLPNKEEEPVSEDLEAFIKERVKNIPIVLRSGFHELCKQLIRDGAKWGKQQTITKACDWLKRNADSYTWYNEFEGESGVTEDFVDEFKKEIQ